MPARHQITHRPWEGVRSNAWTEKINHLDENAFVKRQSTIHNACLHEYAPPLIFGTEHGSPESPIFKKSKSGNSDFQENEIRNFRFSENGNPEFPIFGKRNPEFPIFAGSGRQIQRFPAPEIRKIRITILSRYYHDTIGILWAIQSQCRTHACSHIACVSRYGFPKQGGSQTEGVRGTRLDRAAVQLRMTKFAMPLDCILRNLRKCREYNEHVSEGVVVTTRQPI